MGACCCPCFSRDYSKIPDTSPDSINNESSDQSSNAILKSKSKHKAHQASTGSHADKFTGGLVPGSGSASGSGSSNPIKLDPQAPLFQGMIIDQKYTTYPLYDKKYIWVTPETMTLHMSLYEAKDRRHKVADIADIVEIQDVPPTKVKKLSEMELAEDVFVLISFIRGGGIDLRFKSTQEKNNFVTTLRQVMTHRMSQPAGEKK